MAHVRSQIRSAIVQSLTGLATTGAHVYTGLVYALRDTDLPCIIVTEGDEQVDRLTTGIPGVLQRSLQLHLRTLVHGTQGMENALNQMAAEIEAALGASTLGGLVKNLRLLASSPPDLDDSLQRPSGVRTLVYQATYLTTVTDPHTNL